MENESPIIAEFLLQHNVRLTSPMFSPYRINKRNTVLLTEINEEIIKASATTIEDLILKYKLDFDQGVSIKANHIQETPRTLSENYPDEIRIRNLELPNELDFYQMNTLFYLVKNLISNPCDIQNLASEIALVAESTDLAAKNYQSENIFHIIARERISTNKGEKNIAIMMALTPYIKDPMLLESKNYKGETPIDMAKKNNKELYRIMKKLL